MNFVLLRNIFFVDKTVLMIQKLEICFPYKSRGRPSKGKAFKLENEPITEGTDFKH